MKRFQLVAISSSQVAQVFDVEDDDDEMEVHAKAIDLFLSGARINVREVPLDFQPPPLPGAAPPAEEESPEPGPASEQPEAPAPVKATKKKTKKKGGKTARASK